MPGCATCRHRKVKCDGRAGMCLRCEKLGVACRWTVQLVENENARPEENLTQAGYKRLRSSVACDPCRRRKAKCDALRPSCSTCLRLKSRCSYDGSSINSSQVEESASPERQEDLRTLLDASSGHDIFSGQEDLGVEPSPTMRLSSFPPSGSALLPYIDAFLQNVHPVGCNNFLHPGVLGECLDKAPRVLVLALCGVTAKFTKARHAKKQGDLWIEGARHIVFQSLDNISTLNISVLQFLAVHDMQEGRFISAWNLIGIATRMALQLKLHHRPSRQPSEMNSAEFLRVECHNRLMWTIFVSDLLYAFDNSHISEELMANMYLPCNLWSFTQGTPCTTLRLSQISEKIVDGTLRQSTNPCAYLIKILTIRRKIINFVNHYKNFDPTPWDNNSYFQTLCSELDAWRRSLPGNFAFEERNMFTFRASCHLDIFFMTHVWYHQSGCELYGAWIPGRAWSSPVKGIIPESLLEKCKEKAIEHANGITRLTQKMLKMEPEHLFRDAWFGLCVLDATRIQIAGFQALESEERKGEIIDSLRLYLQALENTKKNLLLAKKVYQELCAIIRLAGLLEAVGLDAPTSMGAETIYPESTIPFFRRYPFLQQAPPDLSGWDELFNATHLTGSIVVTRESSPPRHEDPATTMPDILYALPDNLFSTVWPSDEFQWQPSHTIQDISSLNNGQTLNESSLMGPDHNLMDFSTGSFSHNG